MFGLSFQFEYLLRSIDHGWYF